MSARDSEGEFWALVERRQKLTEELNWVIAAIHEHNAAAGFPQQDYRIALRPDDHTADPFDDRVLMDDIVVRNVPLFRAEQMGKGEWWVCCYLDEATGDRITWNVSARTKPRRIEWTVGEFPEPHHVYEHEIERAAAPVPKETPNA